MAYSSHRAIEQRGQNVNLGEAVSTAWSIDLLDCSASGAVKKRRLRPKTEKINTLPRSGNP